MKTLLPDYVLIADTPDYSSSVVILGNCIADSENDLPTLTEFTGFVLCQGSKCTACDTGAEFIVDSLGVWTKIEKSPFADVYTKSEVYNKTETYSKTEVNDITDTIIANYTSADNDIMAYIWQLMVVSDLNLISVHSGTSTGYFVQDLPIDLPPGDYVWKMQRNGNTQTSMRVKAADDTSLYNVTRGAGVNDITQEFSITGTGAKISIYTGAGVDVWDCMVFRKVV